MSVSLAKYGLAIFGPVLKFILTDYLAKYYHVCGGLFHIPYFHSQR